MNKNLVFIVILFFGLTFLTACADNNGLPNEPSPPSNPGSVGTNTQGGDLVGNAGAVYAGYNSGDGIFAVNSLDVVAKNPNTDSNTLYSDSYLSPTILVGGPVISNIDILAIYKTAYYNVEGSNDWIPVPLTGVALGGNWLKSISNNFNISINGTLLYQHFGYAKNPVNTFSENYLVIFVCKHVGSSWNCFGNHWTINTFNITITDYCYAQNECYYNGACSEINSTSTLGKCMQTANGAGWVKISADSCAQNGKCFYNNACYSPGDFVDATNSICNDDLTWATLPDVVSPGDNSEPRINCTDSGASQDIFTKGEITFGVPIPTHIDVTDNNEALQLVIYNSNSANLTIMNTTYNIVKGHTYTYSFADIYIKNIIVANATQSGGIDVAISKFRDICSDSDYLLKYSCDADGTGYSENLSYCDNGCSNGACIQNKTVCPMIASAAPNWCIGGTIISGTIDSNGCQGPPTCLVPPRCGDGIVNINEVCDGDNLGYIFRSGLMLMSVSSAPEKNVTLNGTLYTIKLIGVSTSNTKATLSVNGEIIAISIGSSRTVSGLVIYVDSISVVNGVSIVYLEARSGLIYDCSSAIGFTSGTLICNSDCKGWNTGQCVSQTTTASSSICLASSGFGCLGAPIITPNSVMFSISNGLGYPINLDSSKMSVYGISCPGNTNAIICAKGDTSCISSNYSMSSAGATIVLNGCTLTNTIKGYINFKYTDNNGLSKLLTIYLSGKVTV